MEAAPWETETKGCRMPAADLLIVMFVATVLLELADESVKLLSPLHDSHSTTSDYVHFV